MRFLNPRFLRTIVWGLLLALALSTSFRLPSEDDPARAPADVFRQVIGNLKQDEIFLDDFERTQRIEKRKMASDPTPSNITATRLFPAGPGMGKIVVSVDGKPTNLTIYREELEKLEKYLAWAAEDGASQKDAYVRWEHKRKERFD